MQIDAAAGRQIENSSGQKTSVGHDGDRVRCKCAQVIQHAILDKNVRIGDGCYISPVGKPDGDTPLYTVQDGIIVIPKNTVSPPGTRL